MSAPDFYPHGPRLVELKETHISRVFLAGNLVYKIKKPVDFGFLDYSTLRKRAHWCRREVELNRRLAPAVYLGVERITFSGGRYRLGGTGAAAEYAVVMKRLPDSCLLSTRLETGRATLKEIGAVARRTALFHSEAAPASRRNTSVAILRRNLEENFSQTAPFVGSTVGAGDYEEVLRYNRVFLRDRLPLLRKRIRDGRFRDCHGDLRAEHICIAREVAIIDCLEFSPRLRQTDVAAEAAFLYMDLLYHGHPHLARHFAESYIRASGDWELRLLLAFYACYRAVVREKVESFRFADPGLPLKYREEARRRAGRYFHLARDLARKDGRPRLFLFGGLPGTGKSTAAAAWSALLGVTWLRSDTVRKEITGTPLAARRFAVDEGIYREEETRRTYRTLMERAAPLLRGGHSAVLDATFTRRWQRSLASELARKTGALLVEVECRAAEKAIKKRLAKRQPSRTDPSDADWKVYLHKKRTADPLSEGTVRMTTERLEEGLAKVAAAAYPFKV
jgi:aminoglycoside phosphotransferase family enzyme/predicted kinase